MIASLNSISGSEEILFLKLLRISILVFPFTAKIKGKNKNEILDNFKKRISFDPTTEFDQAIRQVKQIASLRLKELDNKGL